MPMTKEAVKDRMEDGNTVLLNVVSEADYARLHIKGSENFPKGSDDDFARAVEKKYGKARFFITYCAGPTCAAGAKAAQALRDNGFRADHYPGGSREWSQAGYPTEGTDAKVRAPVPAVYANAN